jgi:hypothetical protein
MNKLSFNKFLSASALACLLAGSPAMAQNKAELQTISNKMFAEGDLHFILVEAYNDELLFEGQSYDFVYKNGVITINEQPLPAAFAPKYSMLIDKFYKQAKGNTFSMKGGGLILSEILDPASSFRTSHANAEKNRVQAMRNEITNTKMLNELANDGLVDTTAGYNISYNYKGFYVNGKKLEDNQHAKYVNFYVAAGGRELLTEKDGNFSMTSAGKTKKY